MFGGLNDSEIKEIEIKIGVELSQSDRSRYIYNYLHLPTNFIEKEDTTEILKQVILVFSIAVAGNQVPGLEHYSCPILKRMDITDTQGKLVTILTEDSNPRSLRVALFTKDYVPEIPFYARDYKKADQYLASAVTDEKTRVTPDKTRLSGVQGSLLQYDLLSELFNHLQLIGSVREITKQVEDKHAKPEEVDKEGRKLVNLMRTMYDNEQYKFQQIAGMCKRLFPDIEDIHPRKHEDSSVSIVIKKKNIQSEIDIAYEASGLDHLFVIIWKVATLDNRSIWFLDEPELHLHPGAQKLLYLFLKDQTLSGKQIFLSTHSMVFIHSSALEGVTLLISTEKTVAKSLADLASAEFATTPISYNIIREHLYEALGYEPRFSFESEKIIVVEGKSDPMIIDVFAKKIGKPIDYLRISFIPLGDRNHVEKYSPILAHTLTNKKCLIILDNDKKDPENTKNEIIRKEREYKQCIRNSPMLNDENFCFYPNNVYSIEHYLLDPEAIYQLGISIFHNLDKEVPHNLFEEIKKRIIDVKKVDSRIEKPKEVLKNILASCGLGNYDEETGVKIANYISEVKLRNESFITEMISAISS